MQTTENYGLKKPESTDQYNIEDFNENMEIIDEAMNKCFQLGNEKREILASNLIAMGVEADVSESWDVLLPKVKDINNGVDTSGDTVTADVLVEGYTAHDANQNQITGTLPDKTGTANHLATASLDSTNSRLKMKVPALGRFGTGNYLYAAYSTIASLIGLTAAKLVKGNTILGITGNSNNMDTSGADATAAHVLAGKKVCVDGELFTGTMANRQGATVDASAVSSDDTYTYFTTPAGSYSSTSKIRTLNSNLGNLSLIHTDSWSSGNTTNKHTFSHTFTAKSRTLIIVAGTNITPNTIDAVTLNGETLTEFTDIQQRTKVFNLIIDSNKTYEITVCVSTYGGGFGEATIAIFN